MSRPISVLLIGASLGLSLGVSIAMDAVLLATGTETPASILGAVLLFNATVIVQAVVGSVIEWRRPGHTIGRLLLLSGPLYALLAAGWVAAEPLQPLVDPGVYGVLNWLGLLLSFPGVAIVAGWLPLLFPTGTLPGRRWRLPVALLVVLSGIGLVAWAVRPGPLVEGVDSDNPFGVAGWPQVLQPFIDLLPLELIGLFVLAVAGLIARYRRGDGIEQLQIRWLLAALTVAVVGFVGVVVERGVRSDDGPLISSVVAYIGILAMPIAIGIAVTRHRLYAIDRIISRTLGWTFTSAAVLAVFATGLVALQTVLADVTGRGTIPIAASTLIAAALFQPLRRRVQAAVDRRFDRATYDSQRIVAAFAGHLRDEVDLDRIRDRIGLVTGETVRPATIGIWLRRPDEARRRSAGTP
ncbi:MAG TPA: hypothetical protein VFO78_07340 [Candidatus Limnocylindrales bacterium]|nr:hypothetical protein [Candidatus Limnocylindrales bacterium]